MPPVEAIFLGSPYWGMRGKWVSGSFYKQVAPPEQGIDIVVITKGVVKMGQECAKVIQEVAEMW